MNKLLTFLIALAVILTPELASGQTAYNRNLPVSDTNPPPSKPMCWVSGAYVVCPAGGGGGGDATAANQTTQITAAQLTNTTLGAVAASPAANTIGDRLKTVNTTLGSPFQAGGSIGNTSFGISGTLPAFGSTPTVNLGTLNGAALDATVSAQSAKLPASLGAKTGATSLSVVPNTDTAFPVTGTFWQATQPVSGTIAATQSGTWNITNISGTVSLPTGAATATGLTTINTTLGTPFQASGALGAGSAIIGKVGIDQTTPGTTNVVAPNAIYNATPPTITTANRGELQIGSRGSLSVQIFGRDSANSVAAIGTMTDGTSNSVGTLATAAQGLIFNGTTWDRMPGNTLGQFSQGSTAAGVAATGNPMPGGCKGSNVGLTNVTSNQRQDVWCGLAGQTVVSAGINQSILSISAGSSIVVMPFTPGAGTTGPLGMLPYVWNSSTGLVAVPGDSNGTVIQPFAVAASRWTYAATSGGISNTTTAVTFIAAAGVGVRNYVTSVTIASDALTNATEVAIRDGASGTVLWRSKIQTSGLPLTTIPFTVPLKGTANTLMEVVTLTASGAGAVYFDAQGYQGS